MNELEKAIKELTPTMEENKIHHNADKFYKLCDIDFELKQYLKEGVISQKEYDNLCENFETLLDTYEDLQENDDTWHILLDEAINEVLEEEE